MQEAPLLSAQGVTYCYEGSKGVQGINFVAEKGTYTSLVGSNGSGKSTLLRVLCGFETAQQGQVLFEGKNVQDIPLRQRAERFAVISQHTSTDFPFTGMEFVLMGLHPYLSRFERASDAQMQFVQKVMQETDTLPFAQRPITQLSGGELQRLILAKALVQKPRLLFLDEAMSEMDVSAKIKMTKLLKKKTEQTELTVLAVQHDVHLAHRFSDRILALKRGKLVANGPPVQVMTKEFFASVFSVQAEIFQEKGFFIYDNLE